MGVNLGRSAAIEYGAWMKGKLNPLALGRQLSGYQSWRRLDAQMISGAGGEHLDDIVRRGLRSLPLIEHLRVHSFIRNCPLPVPGTTPSTSDELR